MIETTINGIVYRIRKLDAFKQFHVSRKIAPIIPTLIPVFVKLSKEGLTGDLSAMGEVFQPFADGLAAMPDDAAEYIISTCLGVVQRQSGGHWANVWSAGGCMFDDLDLSVLIRLTIEVVKDSLGPFINGLLISPQA